MAIMGGKEGEYIYIYISASLFFCGFSSTKGASKKREKEDTTKKENKKNMYL
jgi:hypothetical protein